MGDFLLLELRHRVGQLYIASFAQLDDLIAIVFLDDGLDRLGARMSSLLAEQSRTHAKGKARRIPHRRHRRRPHATCAQHAVERVQMLLLLRRHFLELADDTLPAMLPLEHGELALVDRDRAILAGMVDAQDLLTAIAGDAHGCPLMAELVHLRYRHASAAGWLNRG